MRTEGSTHQSRIITDKAVVAGMLEQDLEATESRLDIVEAELESVKQLLAQEQARTRRFSCRRWRLEHLVEAIAARCRLPHFETDRGNGDFKDRIADLIEAHRAG